MGLTSRKNKLATPAAVFGCMWVLLFLLYYPAARAGFVTDFTGWLDQVRSHSFGEFINRTHFQAKSLYQFTQFNTYVLYHVLGTHAWLWHLLFVTLHAANACLLFVLCDGLLADAGERSGGIIAIAGSVLFCVSPYMSEVIVWEPAFHFLQGLLLILIILLCTRSYIHSGATKWVVTALVVYALSLFTLEVFYITPWLVAAMAVFYRQIAFRGKGRGPVAALVLPMLLLCLLRFVGYRLFAGAWVSRLGPDAVGHLSVGSLGKPAKYLFHLLCLGRFFSDGVRQDVYDACDSLAGIVVYYAAILTSLFVMARRLSRMSAKARVAALLTAWLFIALQLLVILWFQADMLVVFDRYLYVAGGFFYLLFAVVASMITIRYVSVAVISLFALANLRFAIQVSRYWGKSARVVHSLLEQIPADRTKTMLLLNIPQSMHGVPMIGAEKNSEYKLMHDLLLPDRPLTNTVYDVLAYNMLTPDDGAHVNVVNDSTIKVTLNQWGTWWWFETRGGYSYWTTDYKLDLKDPGHWYELTLRRPADNYIILYSVGGQWKRVDMSKKNIDQN
jgi:hypothetical protein